jgi:hypothetical protein
VSGGIIEKIVQAAKARGEAVFKEAEMKRNDELAAGLSKLKTEVEARRAVEKKRAAEMERQELSAFRLVERNKIHVQKRRLLDGVYAAAWQKALQPSIFRAWVEKQLRANCRKGDVITVAADQVSLFSGALSDLIKGFGVTLSPEKGAFRAGFVVDRGDVRLNCTLDQEMSAAIREKEIEISRILFR